jgi:hypothetical protein
MQLSGYSPPDNIGMIKFSRRILICGKINFMMAMKKGFRPGNNTTGCPGTRPRRNTDRWIHSFLHTGAEYCLPGYSMDILPIARISDLQV